MQVSLLNYTKNSLSVIYTAARTCYSSQTPNEILANQVSRDKQVRLIKKVINSGHHSVLEHISFTFSVSGISRACSHQLVRHRLASYSQQSQRYVNPEENIVIPPSIRKDKRLVKKFQKFIQQSHSLYENLMSKGIPKEDARFVLPNATSTNIVITMNLRELINVCAERLCLKAQWEIRELFTKAKESVKKTDNFLGSFLVPKCVNLGYCPEKESCGLMPTKDKSKVKNQNDKSKIQRV